MNHGSGWGAVPWALWLRSGERKYLDHALANSRHLMDVDTNHAAEFTNNPQSKQPGAAGGVGPVHGGFSTNRMVGKMSDAEYLTLAYWITGDERARDVMAVRAEGFRRYDHDTFLARFEADPASGNRELYRMLGEAALFYEASLDERFHELALRYARVILACQRETGEFPGYLSAFWLEWPLILGHRALPEMRVEIAAAMSDWLRFRGTPDHPGPEGGMQGPLSTWTAHLTARWENDSPGSESRPGRHVLSHGVALARSQAAAVHRGEGPWRGAGDLPYFVAAGAMRDWLIADAAKREGLTTTNEPLVPVTHVHGELPISREDSAAGWRGRNLVFVEDAEDRPIDLSFAQWTGPARALEIRLRVTAPDGKLLTDESHPVPGSGAPLKWRLPRDGQRGAYGLEILTAPMAFPVAVYTDTGERLVHTRAGDRLVAVSVGGAGSLAVVARPGATVSYNYQHHDYVPRRAVLDVEGTILAASEVRGEDGDGRPILSSLQWVADRSDPVRLLVSNRDPSNWLNLQGLDRYVATTPKQWFDPEPLTRYDISKHYRLEAAPAELTIDSIATDRARLLVASRDEDNDDRLDKREASRALRKQFSQVDRNGDGFLTAEELAAYLVNKRGGAQERR